MPSLLIAAPILLTLTLLASGLAKLGARQDTEDAMTSLRLPLRPFHRSVATLLPVVEVALALVLWVPSAPLQTLVAVAITALMLTYLVIIARALTFEERVECACFGTLASPTVSRTTLARNVLLSMLSLLTVVSALSGLMETALVRQPLTVIGMGAALLLAIVLTALALGGISAREADAAPSDAAGEQLAAEEEDEELLDYERAPIPPAVLQQADTRLITLQQLAGQRAALLVFVSEGCGPCERVLDEVPGWLTALSPFLQVKAVLSRPLDQLRERTLERVGEHALHDLQFTARRALGARTAPSAVLLGADGLLAGGPVDGGSAVIEFVEEIIEQLGAAQEAGELQGPTA
ncbi:MauE/DoxX family redox-associated membrane protein [Brachybacterium massiliense]|uniref:MauE/DoxX family redox-associated membrane protein n=1 Tax=Brachybacterium massiliense TaxID=1755098 RepID=UPI000B3BB4BF|nr:MauE/DoxX family redox-associated membrane protein [Brachybacterium massiliense]